MYMANPNVSEFGITAAPLTWLHSYLEGWTQFVKLGQHQSPVVGLEVDIPVRGG